MASSFVAYIDEAGDEGFLFDKGSSRWFVLSAVVVRTQNDLDVVKIVDYVKQELEKPREYTLHFRRLKHHQRVFWIGEIAKLAIRIVSVCIHKPSLTARETFGERYRLYYYGARYLLERLSWLCRDHRRDNDGTNGKADLIFSNRAGMSYDELRKYLVHLKNSTGPLNVSIDWGVISEDAVRSYIPGKRMGLQMADAVASSFYYALEPDRHGYTEPRYALMLSERIYRYKGIRRGYGLKVWPRDVEQTIASSPSLSWMEQIEK